MNKKWFIPVGLGFVFLAGVCLVSWVSECHLPDEYYRTHGHVSPWVLMDPPIMSLYLSVPGFITSAIAAVVSFGHAG